MVISRRLIRVVSILLLSVDFLFTTVSALSLGGIRQTRLHDEEQVALPASSTPMQFRNFSVGFSLQSSFSAVAVILEYDDGTEETVVRTLDGDDKYRKVMAHLSLSSSQHLAPPYGMMDQYFRDIPRVIARRALKKIGLPASPEVGVLGKAVKKLRTEIETEFGIHISNAVLTVTHLIAFYEDDAEDLCEYAGIHHVTPHIYLPPPIWETSAAYAGYGFGLCENYKNETECNAEFGNKTKIMAVHYSRSAMTASLPTLYSATHLYGESPYERRGNFGLGSDAMRRYPNPEQYWKDVRDLLLDLMRSSYSVDPEFIIVTGDNMVHGVFMAHLTATVQEYLGSVPPIYSDGALIVAAKGAAEIRRRASYRKKYPWEDWSSNSDQNTGMKVLWFSIYNFFLYLVRGVY